MDAAVVQDIRRQCRAAPAHALLRKLAKLVSDDNARCASAYALLGLHRGQMNSFVFQN